MGGDLLSGWRVHAPFGIRVRKRIRSPETVGFGRSEGQPHIGSRS